MRRLNWMMAAAAAAAMVTLGACGGGSATADRGDEAADALFAKDLGGNGGALRISSPNVTDGAALPSRFSCDSTAISPALVIAGVPDGTAELAIVLDDPDAAGGTYVHWIVAGLPAADTSLAEDYLPPKAISARNSAGRSGYAAVCPPKGDDAHTYRISVYALDEPTGDAVDKQLATDALEAIAERATARATMRATYERAG